MQKPNIIAILLALSALTTSLILNILFRHQYFKLGVNFIYSYQTNHQSSFVTFVQNLISLFGYTYFIVGFIAIAHLTLYRKANTLIYISYIVINVYVVGVAKQAFHDPRPFFFSHNIQTFSWSCPSSFGFPSGHSWMSVLLYEPLISDMIGTKGAKKLLLFIVVLTGSLVPLSRQYLGAHTADQVTCGLLGSFVALILYKYSVMELFYKLFKTILQGTSRGLVILMSVLSFLLILIPPFALFEFNPNYMDRMNTVCVKNKTFQDLQNEAGIESGIIGVALGIVYGLIISASPKFRIFFEKRYGNVLVNQLSLFLVGKWNYGGKFVNVVKYWIVYLLFGGVFLGGLAMGVAPVIRSFQGQYMVLILGYICFGISMTCFIPLILIKLDIIQPLYETAKQKQKMLTLDHVLDVNSQLQTKI